MIPLVLHIGSQKTGSTYLQNWLGLNADQLRNAGILVASSLMANHRIASEVAAEYPAYEKPHIVEPRSVPLEEVIESLNGESHGNYRHSVISSEFFFHMNPKHVSELLEKLGFEVKTIICFLRRQDHLLASSYAQGVKIGQHTDGFSMPSHNNAYEWDRKYRRWALAFKGANLEFFDYEHEKNNHTFLSSFKKAIGCNTVLEDENFPAREQVNLSHDAQILEILRRCHAQGFKAFGQWINPFADHFAQGQPFGIGKEKTAELESIFRQKNVQFQKDYGVDRFPHLVEENWSPVGIDLHGKFPVNRMVDLLVYLQRILLQSGRLPLGKNGGAMPDACFDHLNRHVATHFSGDIARLIENTAHHSIDNGLPVTEPSRNGFPEATALYVLDYACNQLLEDKQATYVPGKGPSVSKRDFLADRLPDIIARPSLSDLSTTERAKFGAQLLWDTFGFDAEYYAAANPDVLVQKVDPYEHFYRYGRHTKKPCRPPFRLLQNTSWKWRPGETHTLGDFTELDENKETVLIVLHEGSRTGAPIIGYNLLLHFVKKYNVVCLILAPGPIARACRDAGAIVVQTLERANSWAAGAYLINRICKQVKFRFAIVNSALSRFVLGGLVMNEIPRVSLIHEAANTYLATHELPYLLTLSDEVVVPSDYVLNSIHDACPQFSGNHYPVIPQGICALPSDIHEAKLESADEVEARLGFLGESADTIMIAGIGTVDYRKGVDLFIQTASRLVQSYPGKNLQFSWIGTGFEPEIRGDFPSFIADQLEKSGLARKLTFAGGINNMEAVYRNIDLLLLTSRMDPMPNVAIEAMANGIPLVCFEKCTGTATYLSKLGLGEYSVAKYLDCANMADRAAMLLSSDTVREKVSTRAEKAVRQELVMDKYCMRIEEIANSVCKS